MRLPTHNTPRKSLNFRGDFLPPKNHKNQFVNICANLWVIYWDHELHESNEFDFCVWGKAGFYDFSVCFVLRSMIFTTFILTS